MYICYRKWRIMKHAKKKVGGAEGEEARCVKYSIHIYRRRCKESRRKGGEVVVKEGRKVKRER
jgi:hypothetical protein